MLCVVIGTFLLNWLPIHIFHLYLMYAVYTDDQNKMGEKEYYTVLFFVCHWLSMSNSFVNPIIYCCMNNNFKVTTTYYSEF